MNKADELFKMFFGGNENFQELLKMSLEVLENMEKYENENELEQLSLDFMEDERLEFMKEKARKGEKMLITDFNVKQDFYVQVRLNNYFFLEIPTRLKRKYLKNQNIIKSLIDKKANLLAWEMEYNVDFVEDRVHPNGIFKTQLLNYVVRLCNKIGIPNDIIDIEVSDLE